MAARARNGPLILLAVVLVALATYALFWYAQMRAFKAEVVRMQSGTGRLFDVQARSLEYGGFPYRLDVVFRQVQLVRRRSDYDLTIDARSIRLTRLTWNASHFVMMADLPNVRLRSRGGTRPLVQAFAAETLESSLRLGDGNRIDRLSMAFGNVTWTGGHVFAAPVAIASLQFHLREADTPSGPSAAPPGPPVFANIRITAQAATLRPPPWPTAAPLNLDAFMDLTGGTGFDDSVPGLARWRQQRGRLALRSLIVQTPGLDWHGTGALGLDAAGHVEGAGTLKTNVLAQTRALLAGERPTPALLSTPTKLHHWVIRDGALLVDDTHAATVPYDFLDD